MIDAVRTRRSIRKYETRPLPAEAVAELKEAMLRSPSSRNLQPWHFAFVTDRATLATLSTAKPQWANFLAEAALGVVICGDEGASDCWIEDCSIAATVLQLTATDLGLGSCWIQIRERKHADGSPAEDFVRETLSMPPNLRVLAMIAIGYPAEAKPPKDAEKLAWHKVSEV